MAGAFYPPLSPVSTGLRCRCPRCGEAPLFDGLLSVKARCPSCDLDYSKIDAGDGPAVFVILILGFIVVGLALWVELRFGPPLWLHMVLWTPVILGGSIALLRPFKATLVALQFKHKASSDIELLRE
jgi:uncharacterized protein (DUF983 family)